MARQDLILLQEGYFERLWGGQKLRASLGMAAPEGKAIGEAWLVSDHANHESVIANGPWSGRTLHDVLLEDPAFLLGTVAKPTVHGRFPLLLKVLDAADVLSVQVHPTDEDAARLDEPDVGKTEMWHVLESAPGSTLICGLDPNLREDAFLEAAKDGSIEQYMPRIPAPAGTTAFVSAGTVHAIGEGILLAEIQQNSDLTYRIYDWNRVDSAGNSRELHLEKAAQVTRFGSAHSGAATPLSYPSGDGTVTVLGACRYFASELVQVDGEYRRETAGRSFHLVMPRDGDITVTSGEESCTLARCSAALIPAGAGQYTLTGTGYVLDYYVPSLPDDIIGPLRAAGHPEDAIARLGGVQADSDLHAAMRG